MRWKAGTEDQSRGWSEAEKMAIVGAGEPLGPGPPRGRIAGRRASWLERPAPADDMPRLHVVCLAV